MEQRPNRWIPTPPTYLHETCTNWYTTKSVVWPRQLAYLLGVKTKSKHFATLFSWLETTMAMGAATLFLWHHQVLGIVVLWDDKQRHYM